MTPCSPSNSDDVKGTVFNRIIPPWFLRLRLKYMFGVSYLRVSEIAMQHVGPMGWAGRLVYWLPSDVALDRSKWATIGVGGMSEAGSSDCVLW